MTVVIPAALAVIAFLGGWFAHRRLSLDYKRRWLDSVKALEDKSLESGGDPATVVPLRPSKLPQVAGRGFQGVAHPSRPDALTGAQTVPYESGRWALWEHEEGMTTIVYTAVRRGFDPIELGRTTNFKRFGALYRKDREQAQDAINDMNAQNG